MPNTAEARVKELVEDSVKKSATLSTVSPSAPGRPDLGQSCTEPVSINFL